MYNSNSCENTIVLNWRSIAKNFHLIVLLYFFIFQPPFISRTNYFLLEFLIFLIFIYLKPSMFLLIFNKFRNECFLFGLIVIYTMFRDTVRLEVVYILRVISWYFQAFIFSLIIVVYFHNKKIINKLNPDLFLLTYWVVVIAAFFSFFLLVNDAFYEFYHSLIIVDPNITYNLNVYRGYGVSENLTFTYSYLLGFFAGYTFYILNEKWCYIVFVPFLIIGVLFNARIGLLPIAIFLCLLFFKKGNYKNILILICSAIITCLVLPKLEIFKYFEHNKNYLLRFFSGPTLHALLHDHIVWPDTISDWIFGTGYNLFLYNHGRPSSDIGYITQLNYGGLIFLGLLFFLFSYMVIRLLHRKDIKNWFTIAFSLSILLINFKGSAFASTPGSRFLYMSYIYMIYKRY